MKCKKILATIISILFLVAGIGTISSQKVEAYTGIVDASGASENFNLVKGHDAQHPIWPVKRLGVLVISHNTELQSAIQQACQEWSPAFKFDYLGYYQKGQRLPKNKDKRFVYIEENDLPGDYHEQEQGVTYVPSSTDGYFDGNSVTIKIDIVDIDERDPQILETVIAHELGHAIGLHHSDNENDVMYPETSTAKSIQPEEFALVRRLYSGKTSTTNSTDNDEDNNQTSSSSKPKKQYKGYYFGNRTPLAVYNKILSHLFLIDDNNKIVGNSCTSYAYHTLYNGRHIGTKSQLHNGTYMGKIPLRITGIRPSSHLRSLSAVFTKDNGYNKGQTMPDSHIVSYHNHIKVDAHSRKSRLYTFYVLFRVRGHYFKLINEN